MARIRTLLLRVATCAGAVLTCAGCGGGGSQGADVVARAPDDVSPESTAEVGEPDAAGPAGTPSEGALAEVGVTAGAGAGAGDGILPTSADPGIVVDVAGAVRRPGVYRMSPGARVHEAIQAAGGARRGAALGALNRAAVLVDGQQVLVGITGAGGAGPSGVRAATGTAAGGPKVNLNSADAAALDALPGVGQVTAEHIIASREEAGPFASIDDLDRVPGIGPTTVESLRAVATT